MTMTKFQESIAKAMGIDLNKKKQGICLSCDLPAADRCTTEAGKREFEISGTCEVCFDSMFGEEEPE
jgi:hypothetical protein